MRRNYIAYALAIAAILFFSQDKTIAMSGPGTKKELAQDRVCRIENAAQAGTECRTGDVFLYLPVQATNTKLPVIVSALFCDFDRSITTSPESVSCIFTDKRRSQWKEYGVKLP
ncbi:hypothetical protein ACPV5U_24540 [Vibrio mediterranei]|jgi:hypothetical protein